MGSKKVYMSEIMSSVDEHLAQTVAALSSVVTNLQIVNASVAQNLETLAVAPGPSKSYQAISEGRIDAIGNGTDGAVKTSIGALKMLCNGGVKIAVQLSNDTTTSYGSLWIKKNSGAWEKFIPITKPEPFWYVDNLDVAFGDVIEFAIGGYASGKYSISWSGIVIQYDIKNLAESGAFAVV